MLTEGLAAPFIDLRQRVCSASFILDSLYHKAFKAVPFIDPYHFGKTG